MLAFNLSLFEAAENAEKRAEIAVAAWGDFQRRVRGWSSSRAAFDFPPAEIHCRNVPKLAEKQVVLQSLHGKIAFFARIFGLQPVQYQPKAF